MRTEDDRLGPHAVEAYHALRDLIGSGRLPPGAKLPSQPELARRHGVALMTMRQALSRLEREGLVKAERGRGTFVLDSSWDARANAGLNEREEWYRMLLETSPDAITVSDLDGTVLMANRQAAQLFGYERPEQLVGRNGCELLAPEASTSIIEQVKASLRSESRCPVEQVLVRRDGTRFSAEVSVSYVRDSDRQPVGVLAIARDTTERNEVAARLLETETRYRALVEELPAAIYISGLGDGCPILYISPYIKVMLGYPAERWTEDAGFWLQILHPDDREWVLEQDRETNRTGQPFRVEYRLIAADGRTVWVREDGLLIRDPAGAPQYWQGIIVDITARKEAEAQAMDTLHAAVRSAPIAIVCVDLRGHVTSWNDAAERLFGWAERDVLGSPIPMIPGDPCAESEHILARSTRGETVTDVEARRLRKDGSTVDVSISSTPLRRPDGEIVGAMGAYVDISERKQTEAALRAGEAQLRSIVDHAAIGIARSDLDGRWLFVNQQLCEIVGYSREELLSLRFQDITHPDDLEPDLAGLERLLAGEIDAHSLEKRYIRKDGSTTWTRLCVTLGRDGSGAPIYTTAIIEDVTERKRAEEALRASEARHRQMFVNNEAIKWLIDPETGQIVDANPAAAAFYGYSLEQLTSMHVWDINTLSVEELYTDMVRAAEEQSNHFVFQHRLASGEIRDVELYSSPIDVDGKTLLYSIIHDITDRKRAQEALEHQALHDALTNLPNRTLLTDRLKHIIRARRRNRRPAALLLMDLDRFKEINDTFGHHYGDLVLQEVGRRLQDVLRGSDTVARLGGDEFALLLPATDEAGAVAAATKLIAVLARPVEVEDHTFHVGASIGITIHPEHGEDAATLLRRADVAMYLAKRSGSEYVVYSAESDQYSASRLALTTELRRALESGQLLLHYQPKVNLRTGRAESVEALLRWEHPTRGSIPPDQFIPLAEQAGLMHTLSAWVLSEAMRQCRRWRDEGLFVRMAVNLSPRNLYDPQIASTISALLASCKVDASWLEVEVTESTVMDDPVRAIDVLASLHQMGIRIAVDDFGTGYSSLAYLQRLPVDEIKIDKSFVLDMARDDNNRSIVRATISLGHDLGLEAVAEGVENQVTWDLLTSLGCDTAQGYLLSRPLPARDCARWLREWSFQVAS